MIKKERLFIFISFLFAFLLVVAFHRHWCLTVGSLLPLFFALLSLALAVSFRKATPREEQTAYGSDLTPEEQGLLGKYSSFGFGFSAPWQGIFLFFFPTAVKMVSVVLFLASFFVGPGLFRMRYGKELKSRLLRERSELEEQRRKEESGKWK